MWKFGVISTNPIKCLSFRSFAQYAVRWNSSTTLRICSVHNRNRLAEDLEACGTKLECKFAVPCILENPESSPVCALHKQERMYVDLIQKGNSLYCNGLMRCDERYTKCSRHGILRSLRQLKGVNESLVCTPPFECDTKLLCDFHREYRKADCLVGYKGMHICRSEARCVPHSYSAKAIPVDTFLFLDELWGDGEDVLTHRLAEKAFRKHCFPGDSTVGDARTPSHQTGYHEAYKFEYLKDTMEWKKR